MACLGTAADARFLGLDEIADAVVAGELSPLAQIREGADLGVLAYRAIFGANANFQMASRTDGHVAEPCGAVDADAFANLAMAKNLHPGTDHAVGRDLGLLGDVG